MSRELFHDYFPEKLLRENSENEFLFLFLYSHTFFWQKERSYES